MTRASVRSTFPSSRLPHRSSFRVRARAPHLPALTLLGLLVVGAPELFGGVFPWTVVVIASVALATLVATLWAVHDTRPEAGSWVVIAVCGAAAWTCLQAMPLPCWLVSKLAPDAVSELHSALSLAGKPPPLWCVLSRDPGATQLEMLKGVAIVSSFLAAWWLSAHGARARVIWLVACSTLTMSVVAHLHSALGLQEVFGVYRPRYAGRGLQLAPLMNPNNLGGFAALGVPIWLGILRREREPGARVLAVVATVLTATTALLSLSRGAIGMLVGGSVLMLVFAPSPREGAAPSDRGFSRLRSRLAAVAVLSLGLGMGAYLAADRVLAEFVTGGASKLTLTLRTLAFAGRHPWLGVGRGAFANAYLGHGDAMYYVFTENFFTQWACDWGFPVAIGLTCALGHGVWVALRNTGSMRRLGAAVGLVALAAQNLFDLGFELVGVATVAAALLGAVTAPSRPSERARQPIRLAFRHVALAVVVPSLAALVWLGPSAERDSRDGIEASLRAQLEAGDRKGFKATLARGLRLHPIEPLFAVLAASEALRHRDRGAPRWINRGMRLAPGWTAPHIEAFEWLWMIGHRDQALLELRAAAEIDPSSTRTYACRIAQVSSAMVLRGAPRLHSRQRADFLETASNCAVASVSLELDRVLLREFPDSPAARERDALRRAKRGEIDAALAELDGVLRKNRARVETRTLKVRLLFEAKRYAEAARTALALQRSLPLQQTAPLWRLRASALAALGDDAGWLDAIAALRRIASDDVDQLANTYALEGELHSQRGQPGEALRAYREAYRINEDAKYLQRYADISTQLGDHAAALWAYMELCQKQADNAAYCARRDTLLEQARAMNFGQKLRN